MKVLFLGLGGAGQRHLRNLRALRPEATILAVRHAGRRFEIGDDLAPDFSSDIVSKYGIRILPNLDAAIANQPDLAIVASPSSLHVEQATTLIEAGVPTFVEKPLATSREGLDRFYTAARQRGIPVAVGYQLRHHPCAQRLKALLDAHRIGRLQSIEVTVHSHMPSWHGYEKPNEFYAGVAALGGGVVLTEIHEIDMLCWLFGRPQKVAAFGGTVGGYDIDVEDTVAAILEFPGPLVVTLAMSFVQRPPGRRFVVNGSNGRIVMKIPKASIVVEDTTGSEIERLEVANFDRNGMFVAELRDFLTAVESHISDLSLDSIRDGQDAALAIKAAYLEGRVIPLAVRAT
jgi:predicted dehydrogenase